jgi:HD superfamily phosphodiesterase
MNAEAAIETILQRLRNELPAEYTYHSPEHTEDVIESAVRIAEFLQVGAEDTELLKVACAYHDAGFLNTYADHEQAGCALAKQYLPEFGFTDREIECITGMIMSTKIPQTPQSILEEIICDADLDYLGRDDFEQIGTRLYHELKSTGRIAGWAEWNQLQISFLKKHSYHTAFSKNFRQTVKENHLHSLIHNINT